VVAYTSTFRPSGRVVTVVGAAPAPTVTAARRAEEMRALERPGAVKEGSERVANMAFGQRFSGGAL